MFPLAPFAPALTRTGATCPSTTALEHLAFGNDTILDASSAIRAELGTANAITARRGISSAPRSSAARPASALTLR